MEQLATGLQQDENFARNYKPWLVSKLTVTALKEDKIIEKFSLEELKRSVSTYATHQGNLGVIVESIWKEHSGILDTFKDKKVFARDFLTKYYATEVSETLLKSPTFMKAAGAKFRGGAGQISGEFAAAVKVADLEEYDKIFVAETIERQRNIQDDLITADLTKGMRIRDKFYLRLGSGTSISLHTPIHEFMHNLSSLVMTTTLSGALNEGLTERITLIIMNEAGIHCAGAYDDERRQVERLVAFLTGEGFTELDLYYAYFNAAIMGGAAPGLIDAIATFVRDPTTLDKATVRIECQTRSIKFDDNRWKTSPAYREAKLNQITESKANRTIWGLMRQVANGGEKYVQLQGLTPILGF